MRYGGALKEVVCFAGLDVLDEGAEGFSGVGEVGVFLACDGYVGVVLGVGAYAGSSWRLRRRTVLPR